MESKYIKYYVRCKNMNKNARQFYKALGMIVCTIVFCTSIIINYSLNGTVVLNQATYDIVRKAETHSDNDPLSGKIWEIKSDILLSPLLKILDYDKAILLLLAVLLAVTLGFTYMTLSENYVFLYILSLSPFFLSLFVVYSDYTIIAALISIIAYLFSRQKYMFAFIVQLLIAYFNYYAAMIIVTTTVSLFIIKKLRFRYVLLFTVPIAMSISTMNNNKALESGISFMQMLFTDFGAKYGISIALSILGLIGLVVIWKREPLAKYLFMFSAILCIIKISEGLFFANIIMIYLASKAVMAFIEEKWHNAWLKQISILLIFCSILFSGISYAKATFEDNMSDPDLMKTLEWIRQKTPENSTVLSYSEYSYVIKFYSSRKVIVESEFSSIDKPNPKLQDIDKMFKSRNVNTTAEILSKYSVDYILITKEMKTGLIWNKDDEGLLFVMTNSDLFSKTFSTNNTELWWFNRIK